MSGAERLPLLLVPGTLCDARLWQAQASQLAHERPVHAVEWRGERDMRALAARILAEAPARFAIAGMSMGGSIALEVCAQARDRVGGLAMIDAQPAGDAPGRREARQAQIAYARAHGLARLVQDKLWPQYVHPSRLGDVSLLALVQSMAEACGLQQFECQSELLASRRDHSGLLASLAVPVLVLAGSHDLLCPPQVQRAMAESAVSPVLAQIEGCGHFAVLEAGEPVLAHMRAWLDRCDRTTPTSRNPC